VISFTESRLNFPVGAIKGLVLIENILAAFEMDEILYEMKSHILGLNSGKWDYIFSFIKKFSHDPAFIFPDRSQITSDATFLSTVETLLVKTCKKREAIATAGMAPFLITNNSEIDSGNMQTLKDSKKRIVKLGFDGDLVAHPAFVASAKSGFEESKKVKFTSPTKNRPGARVEILGDFSNWQPIPMTLLETGEFQTSVELPPGKFQYKYKVDGEWVHSDTQPKEIDSNGNVNNIIVVEQPENIPSEEDILAKKLIEVPKGTITTQGIKTNVSVFVNYVESWVRGAGAIDLNGKIEDLATAEICRAQLWQWIKHKAPLSGNEEGATVTLSLVKHEIDLLISQKKKELGSVFYNRQYLFAREKVLEMLSSSTFLDFMPTLLYQYIVDF